MAALSSGHLATDLAQGSLPALLPFLKVEFDLSYTMASALVLAATISSSLIQPLFGLWSDARGALWLLPAGVALAGVGMALAAAAPSYPLIFVAVLAAGVGVAAYHPEGSKFASYASGTRRASGMSFFSVGGNIGFALGPVYASALILALGLKGGLLIAVPGLAVATGLVFMLRYLSGFAPDESPRAQRAAAAKTETRGLVLLLLVYVSSYGVWILRGSLDVPGGGLAYRYLAAEPDSKGTEESLAKFYSPLYWLFRKAGLPLVYKPLP